MSAITYNLLNAATLVGMAPPALGGGMFGAAALPLGLAGGGMYIIWNTNTNNRYAGISTNLATRFQPRLETVTELGFSGVQMNQIVVFWGTAQSQNTAGFGGVLVHPIAPVLWYGAPLNMMVDGVAVNLERLLIRFMITQLGGGGTVSNNMMAFAPYGNPTPNPITVTLNWGACPWVAAGGVAAVWPVGGPAW